MTGLPLTGDPRACEVLAPYTVDEAVQLLVEIGDAATVLAGGTDLMPDLEVGRRRIHPIIIDLHRIESLRRIVSDEEQGELVIGAMVTPAQLEQDPLIATAAPLLAEASMMWSPLEIANRATVGGNVMTAGAAGDLATALLALRAVAVLASNEGCRRVPLFSLLVGKGRTSAKPSELLIELRLPSLGQSGRGRFRKVSGRGGSGGAKVNLASFAVDEPGPGRPPVVIALGGVAEAPTRLRETERILATGALDAARIERAVRGLDGEITPVDDLISSARYRRTLAIRLLRAALEDLA